MSTFRKLVSKKSKEKEKEVVQSSSNLKSENKHLIIEAYAGTGKTFSLIVGVAWAFGRKHWSKVVETLGFDPIPSNEQKIIWDEMSKYENIKNITYCAFNKRIVTEFEEKWGWLVNVLREQSVYLNFATVNSLGSKVLYQAFGKTKLSTDKTKKICDSLLVGVEETRRKSLVYTVDSVVDLCKLTLLNWEPNQSDWLETITEGQITTLCDMYGIEYDSREAQTITDLTKRCLKISLDVEHTKEIDFNDQNWLPVVLNLPVPQVNLIMVDEAQDLPKCKQEFVQKLGKSIIAVGDVRQAIYGFSGADIDSIPNLKKKLGVETSLRLTQTRRCGKAIVKEAQFLVTDFTAHESNSEGEVLHDVMSKYQETLKDNDAVLCRLNAPLVSEAIKLIKQNRKAIIYGRDFGTGLINFINSMKSNTVHELRKKTNEWLSKETKKEMSRQFPNEMRIQGFEDKYSCIMAFSKDCNQIQEVIERINLVFSGKLCNQCRKSFNETLFECPQCKCELVKPKGILHSSIHKSKGLEFNRVYLIEPKGAAVPHPMAKLQWQYQQELHLRYIAITRARHTLVYVEEDRYPTHEEREEYNES